MSKALWPLRRVYLDHAAATPLDPRVVTVMMPYFKNNFANPSALYQSGVVVKKAIEESRRTVAEILGSTPDTIFFTGSGTESTNLAIQGVADAWTEKPGHIVTTQIEHHAVLRPLAELEKHGWQVTYLKPDANGKVTPEQVQAAIRPDTALVSVMYANNEIGTVLPVAEIGRRLARHRKEEGSMYPYFHVDACQAAGYLPLLVEKIHADLLTLNGSKIYGPKGVGVLYVRRGTALSPIILGGGQEQGLRSGTENVAAIVGFGTALRLVTAHKEKTANRVKKLAQNFAATIIKKIPGAILNGPAFDSGDRLPNNVSVTITGIDGETAVLYLDAQGIDCSVASACASEEGTPSHVLSAIGKSPAEANATLRFTLGHATKRQDLVYAEKALIGVYRMLTLPKA